ncbi:replication initiation protein, partial [Pseudoalteromonas sp. 43-MNA-CIBAN-0464]|uniref:replication initiation protein n=1 Tax=Pseudoalteromonas sp. 43-MNA-CIBAN-0464 TaxID=3140425 RepID=UPI0033173BC2
MSIITAPDGRSAPLRYAAAVEIAQREKLCAEISYPWLISKITLYPHWQDTTWYASWNVLYSVGDYEDV